MFESLLSWLVSGSLLLGMGMALVLFMWLFRAARRSPDAWVIDDDDVSLHRSAPCLDNKTLLEEFTFLTKAVLHRRGHRWPDDGGGDRRQRILGAGVVAEARRWR